MIELLVVIAIISLLVSILLPSLQRAKLLAQSAVCLSTQRSLGMGLQMYTAEHAQKLPRLLNRNYDERITDNDSVPGGAFATTSWLGVGEDHWQTWLLGVAPAWRTMITTNRWDAPVDMKVGENFKIWCPDLRTFDPYWWGVWQKRTEQTWWYACYGQYRPNLLVDLRGVDTRMMFWLPKPLGLRGVLYWAVNSWKGDIRTTAHNAGDGYLFYPDATGLPQPSVRAMIVRDGIDDYDLIDMLAEAQPDHGALDFRDLARTPYQYSRDPRALLARRVEILRALAMTARVP